jgi:multiple sugar transport system permease protein
MNVLKNKDMNHIKKIVNKYLLYILGFIVVFIIFVPIFLMLPSMFKTKYEIFAYPWTLFPKNWVVDNFSRIFYLEYTTMKVNYFRSLFTTILVSSLAVFFSIIINMMAAFAFARLNFVGKKPLWVLIITTMFIPGITILLTSIKVVSSLKMIDSIWVLVVPGLTSAYNIFFFRQFFLGFPKSIDEAARIDGATNFQIFRKIYFPMAKTPMVIIGASIFMGYYNSYLWPSLTITTKRTDLYQIMYIITNLFRDSMSLGYGAVLAAAFIAMVPPLIIFVILQRHIKDGIALTGIK